MTSNGSANGSLLASSSVPGPGPTGASCDNPAYDGRVNGVELSPLLHCHLAKQKDAIAKLLNIELNRVVSLLDFLNNVEVDTFKQVGGLRDDCVQDLRQSVAKPSVGTFNNFLDLREIFRPMVLLQQQGKREEKRTGADIFIQVRVSIFF
jgi:hypothetical protein